VEVLEDGRLLTAGTDGHLAVDGAPLLQVGGAVYALDVAGSTVVVATEASVLTVDLDAGSDSTRTVVDGGTPWVAALRGGMVAALVEDAGPTVASFDLPSGERRDLVTGHGAQFVLTPGAGRV